MTKEETLDCIKVMQAYCDGAEIEIRSKRVLEDIWEAQEPNWNWSEFNYRIKPTSKMRPWKAEEVPLDAWFCTKRDPKECFKLTRFNTTSGYITNTDDDGWSLTEALDNLMHSLDGGKTWLPCGVKE